MSALKHRGPDGEGRFSDGHVSLGHTRLSILDLSNQGVQPMFGRDQSVVVVFNGEIYNFQELRSKELSGFNFHSQSDSEVIPYLYEKFGIGFIEKLRGIFSIALYDSKVGKLYLIRDRFGVKPLYYTIQNNRLYFASELKAFSATSELSCEIDFDRYIEYMGMQYVPGENTIFKNVYRVAPGSYLEVLGDQIRHFQYYSLLSASNLPQLNAREVHSTIQDRLLESLKYRLVSDVPIGVLLSGGLDSSTLVALLARIKAPEIKTYSVGFGAKNDELKYAGKVAERFATRHTELLIQPGDIKKYISKIIRSLDEPLSDTGALASWLMFKHIKESSGIKVLLVGEGADEIFAGYSWHVLLARIQWLPEFIKNHIFFKLTAFAHPVIARNLFKNIFSPRLHATKDPDYLNKILRFEMKNNLVNNLLMKVDKSSMAFGIEAREVFLDHALVEAAFSVPGKLKLKGTPKAVLKEIMRDSLPKEILSRKKQGFIMPVDRWIHNEWKEEVQGRLMDPNSFLSLWLPKKDIQNLFQVRRGRVLESITNNSTIWRAYLFEIFREEFSTMKKN